MDAKDLHGVVPYLPTPLTAKGEVDAIGHGPGHRAGQGQAEHGPFRCFDLEPFVKGYFDHPSYGTLDKLNFASKSMFLASLFHVSTLGKQAFLLGPVKYNVLRDILPDTCSETLKYTCMIFWIIILASAFSTFYTAIGASRFIEGMVLGLELNRYVILAIMMVILLMLGMVLDTVGIILITLPIFAPIAKSLGFDPVWFGILYIINMEIGFLTPPFGYNLFYLKGVAPSGVTMTDIYKSVVPFILLMLLGILICVTFPEIILVVPNWLFG